jgi:hypothetical protein
MTNLNPEQYVIIAGQAFERDMLGVVGEIQYRWPNLRVQYLDPDSAKGLVDAPYQIVERTRDGRERVVLQVWAMDQTVLDKLHMMDQANVDVQKLYDDQVAKAKAERDAKKAEESGKAQDLLATGAKHLSSGKLRFTFRDEESGDLRVVKNV